MIAIIRLAVFGFLGLSVVYLLVSAYSRSVRRESLEKEWDASHEGDDESARTAYIREGMQHYEHGLRKKLIVLVYVVPVIVVAVTIYLINVQ